MSITTTGYEGKFMNAIYFGQDPGEIISAVMVLTPHDKRKIEAMQLKGSSYITDNGFKCVVRNHGNNISQGVFKTAKACNQAYDNYHVKKEIEALRAKLKSRGYFTNGRFDKNPLYQVKDERGKVKAYRSPEKARAAFEKIIYRQIKQLEKKLVVIPASEYI